MNNFNNYLPNYNQRPNIDQALQNFQNILGQYQQMQQPLQPAPMSNQGRWLYVNDYNDVISYPTPSDGNAMLFINLDKGLLWSKKFVNGSNSIQTFMIQPYNTVSTEPIVQEQEQENKRSVDIEKILERLDRLEDEHIRKTTNTKSASTKINEQ